MEKRSLKVNALLNSVKQVCTVVFPLISFPYVYRVLGPDGYGKVNFASSIVLYFSLLAALGINTYAVREGARLREDKEAMQQFACQIFTLNFLTTILAYFLLVITWLIWPKLHNYTSLLLVRSFIIVFATVGCEWINVIYEDFLYITIRYIALQILALGSMFLFIRKPQDYLAFAMISVGAEVGAGLLNIFYIRRYVKIHLLFQLQELKKHLAPMLILFGNALAVNIYVNSDVTLLGIFRNDEEVGYYSFSVKIYMIVKQLIAAVVAVAIPKLSSLLGNQKKEEYNLLLMETLEMFLTIMAPIIAGLFMVAPEVVYIIGGEKSVKGTASLQILSIALGFAIGAYFFTSCILIPNRQDRTCFISTIVGAIVNITLNCILIPIWGLNAAALTTVIAEMIVFLFTMFKSGKYYDKLNIKRTVFSICLGCLSIIIICFLGRILVKNSFLYLGFAIVFSAIAYLVIQIVCKNKFVLETLKISERRNR